jgi:hypothetical protein
MNVFLVYSKTVVINVVCIVFFVFSVQAFAQENEDDSVSRIYRIDHQYNQLWVQDKMYIMPISLNVYILDKKTRKKTKVNRYALRKGQGVSLKKTIRNRQELIDEIIIYK